MIHLRLGMVYGSPQARVADSYRAGDLLAAWRERVSVRLVAGSTGEPSERSEQTERARGRRARYNVMPGA